jgi:hypothetical protein
MDTPADPPVAVRSRWTFRRVFRWGVVFWIAAWIFSVGWSQHTVLQLKGSRSLSIDVWSGAVSLQVFGPPSPKTDFTFHQSAFLWSPQTQSMLKQTPDLIYWFIAKADWNQDKDATSLSIPVAGFLWLWLAAGWTLEIRRFRKKDSLSTTSSSAPRASHVRIGILTVFLISLGVGLPVATRIGKIAVTAGTCFHKIRAIQMAVRKFRRDNALFDGDPLPWKQICGPGRVLGPEAIECPAGGTYQLSSVQPLMGPVARCPHPEHQRVLQQYDTSRWW